ncbi:hypothetical protein I547_3751 [Mycobacterium kansasii 824]|nr:hypothetical protein I547_3751 [Mycobacterium kansasii 824]
MHIHVNQLARRSACATLHSAEVTFMLPGGLAHTIVAADNRLDEYLDDRRRTRDEPVPEFVVAVRPRFHLAAQPGGHGFDAHRPGRPGG